MGLSAVLSLSAALAVAGAAPAAAHSGNHLPDSKYFQSTITSVSPQVKGLDLQLIKSGESITLTNRTGKLVTITGYTGEEYLRISPTGVEENINSLSSFLNGSLVINGFAQQLTQGQQSKPPEWRKVSSAPTYTWHDHRMHWMAQERPPMVAADPRHEHKVFDWSMDLAVDGQPVAVTGTLVWLGAPLLGGLALALVVTGGTVLVALVGLLVVRLRVRRGGSGGSADQLREPERRPVGRGPGGSPATVAGHGSPGRRFRWHDQEQAAGSAADGEEVPGARSVLPRWRFAPWQAEPDGRQAGRRDPDGACRPTGRGPAG